MSPLSPEGHVYTQLGDREPRFRGLIPADADAFQIHCSQSLSPNPGRCRCLLRRLGPRSCFPGTQWELDFPGLRSLQSPDPVPWPVQWPHEPTPPPRSLISSEGPRLGFHAHKMPEIKARLMTQKVLKLLRAGGGVKFPVVLAPSLGSIIKQGVWGPGRRAMAR